MAQKQHLIHGKVDERDGSQTQLDGRDERGGSQTQLDARK
jgi:hypothetical protein